MLWVISIIHKAHSHVRGWRIIQLKQKQQAQQDSQGFDKNIYAYLVLQYEPLKHMWNPVV